MLTGKQYPVLSMLPKHSEPIHSAIHDLESFFWVLLHQSLVCSGPGSSRRKELQDPKEALHKVVYALFDDPDMRIIARSKFEFFRNGPNHLESEILPLIHPYFERLKPLLVEWWTLLYGAYYAYDKVTEGIIHDQVLDILVKHLEEIKKGQPRAAEEEAEASKLKIVQERKEAFPELVTSQSSVSPQLPSHAADTTGNRSVVEVRGYPVMLPGLQQLLIHPTRPQHPGSGRRRNNCVPV